MASDKDHVVIELRQRIERSQRIVRECSYDEIRHYAAGQLAAFYTALDLVSLHLPDFAPRPVGYIPDPAAREVPVR